MDKHNPSHSNQPLNQPLSSLNHMSHLGPEEDIEFRPLNKGLGFHRKGSLVSARPPLFKNNVLKNNMLKNNFRNSLEADPRPGTLSSNQTLRSLGSNQKKQPSLGQPKLPSSTSLGKGAQQRGSVGNTSFSNLPSNINNIEEQTMGMDMGMTQNTTMSLSEIEECRASFFSEMLSATIDHLFIFALVISFSLAVLKVNQTNFDNTWEYLNTDFLFYFYGPIFFLTYFFYFLLFQTFIGQTLGQWPLKQKLLSLKTTYLGDGQFDTQICAVNLWQVLWLTLFSFISLTTFGLFALLIRPKKMLGLVILKVE